MTRLSVLTASRTGRLAAQQKPAVVTTNHSKPGEWPPADDDRALPGLAFLRQARLRAEVLSRLLAEWLGPEVQLLESQVVPCCYVPGKRCTFQLELMTRARGTEVRPMRVAGKIYSQDHGAKVYRTLQRLRRHGFATDRLLVPQPLAYDADRKLLLLTWVEGDLLRAVLGGGTDDSRQIEEAAAWLLRLHHCGMKTGRRYTFERHLHTLGLFEQRVAEVYPESAGMLKSLLQRIGQLGAALSGWTPGPTHRDFSPDHLVSDSGRLTALDFDEFCQYDPMFDVSHFIAHLRLLGLRQFGSMTRFDRLAKRFQAAYRAGASNYSEARLKLYEGVAYFKLAHIVGVLQRPPAWKETVDSLLSEAQRALL